MKWAYKRRLDSFEGMQDMPKAVRRKLAACASLEKLRVRRALTSGGNDAVKFVFDPGIESVLLLDGRRRTACLSTQLGCSLGCRFCATGKMGLIRDLTQAEVLGQLIAVNDALPSPASHIVFMGTGEALSNFEVFRSSCEILMHEWGFGLSGRRITVSTAGVVPSIERLAAEGPAVGLAVSLNAHTDEVRSRLMPVNKTYPIREVVRAARNFRGPLTFEYVVIPGVNDGDDAVKGLARLLAGIRCKVNCIPLNVTGRSVPLERVRSFADSLFKNGLMATVRRSRGADIGGACGMLGGAISP
jgi:23S rRNA (adenine2503-C2)-methyltransferase